MTKVYEGMVVEHEQELMGEQTQFNIDQKGHHKNETSSSLIGATIIRGGNNDANSAKQENSKERLEDFHDKFNVTLAANISPMLRSVLLIRSVNVQDTGSYQCQVSDGIYTLSSETLLFLCH
jgi:hypothetical protein